MVIEFDWKIIYTSTSYLLQNQYITDKLEKSEGELKELRTKVDRQHELSEEVQEKDKVIQYHSKST